MDEFRNIKVKRVVQETRIIAICEEIVKSDIKDLDGTIQETEVILDANVRPIPVPYTEEP